MSAVDWAELEALYVADNTTTIQSIADKYGVTFSAVKSQHQKGKWLEKRKKKTENIVQKITEQAEKTAIDIAVKFNADDIKIAQAIKAKIVHALRAEEISPQEINSLSNSLATAQKVGRLALGMTTDNTVNQLTGANGTALQPPVFNFNPVKPKNESS